MVKAIWDFEASDPSHISFQKSELFDADIDESLERWTGYKLDQKGYIPAKYIEAVTHPRETERQIVKAKYRFSDPSFTNITFEKGAIFEADTFQTRQGWIGYIDDVSGRFPSDCVEILSSVSSSTKPDITPTPRIRMRAHLGNAVAEGSDLSFQASDIIEIEEQDLWNWRIKAYLNGAAGMVPARLLGHDKLWELLEESASSDFPT